MTSVALFRHLPSMYCRQKVKTTDAVTTLQHNNTDKRLFFDHGMFLAGLPLHLSGASTTVVFNNGRPSVLLPQLCIDADGMAAGFTSHTTLHSLVAYTKEEARYRCTAMQHPGGLRAKQIVAAELSPGWYARGITVCSDCDAKHHADILSHHSDNVTRLIGATYMARLYWTMTVFSAILRSELPDRLAQFVPLRLTYIDYLRYQEICVIHNYPLVQVPAHFVALPPEWTRMRVLYRASHGTSARALATVGRFCVHSNEVKFLTPAQLPAVMHHYAIHVIPRARPKTYLVDMALTTVNACLNTPDTTEMRTRVRVIEHPLLTINSFNLHQLCAHLEIPVIIPPPGYHKKDLEVVDIPVCTHDALLPGYRTYVLHCLELWSLRELHQVLHSEAMLDPRARLVVTSNPRARRPNRPFHFGTIAFSPVSVKEGERLMSTISLDIKPTQLATQLLRFTVLPRLPRGTHLRSCAKGIRGIVPDFHPLVVATTPYQYRRNIRICLGVVADNLADVMYIAMRCSAAIKHVHINTCVYYSLLGCGRVRSTMKYIYIATCLLVPMAMGTLDWVNISNVSYTEWTVYMGIRILGYIIAVAWSMYQKSPHRLSRFWRIEAIILAYLGLTLISLRDVYLERGYLFGFMLVMLGFIALKPA